MSLNFVVNKIMNDSRRNPVINERSFAGRDGWFVYAMCNSMLI